MDTVKLAFEAAWLVLVAGLILGAGLPALFALGVRLGAGAEPALNAEGVMVDAPPSGVARILAAACFAMVLFGVVLGVMVIVGAGFGMEVSFEHFLPTLAPKD